MSYRVATPDVNALSTLGLSSPVSRFIQRPTIPVDLPTARSIRCIATTIRPLLIVSSYRQKNTPEGIETREGMPRLDVSDCQENRLTIFWISADSGPKWKNSDS